MSAEDGDLAATYTLIYSFLTERSHFKAAEAVKKAVKGVIEITGGDKDGPALPVILNQWKKFTAGQGKKAKVPSKSTKSESSSSSSDSDSSEDSDSSSKESSSESDSDTGSRKSKNKKLSGAKVVSSSPKNSRSPKPKAGVKSKVKTPTSKSSPPASKSEGDSSSSSDSESSDSDDSEVKRSVPVPTPKTTKAKKTAATTARSESGDSSSSDSDSSDSEEEVSTPKAVVISADGAPASLAPKSRSPAGSSQTLPSIKGSDSESSGSSTSAEDSNSTSDSDSDSDDSSDSDSSDAGKKPAQASDKSQKTKVAKAAKTSAIPSPQKSDEPTAVTKRRRTDEAGSSVATSVIQQPKTSNPHQKGNGKNQPRKSNTPFSRVKVDEVKFADERLKDNTFGSRGATGNDYGAKASADLIVTRGASFRKEKGKKKRGSYRGGDITMESHSIKFTD